MNPELCARSIRELARRMLRSRGVIIQTPDHIDIDDSLSLKISDLAPSLYFGFEIKFHKKEQIVKGKLNKFIKENTLMGQALITDPKNTVANYVTELSKSNNLDLNIISMDLYTI